MNKFLAAAAFAVALVPAIANAASFYDPSVDSGSSPFIALPAQVNPANAAAAAADAQRYANVAGNPVIGTHGTSPSTVIEYDPGLDSGTDFVAKTILPGATARIAQPHYTPYADNSELIGD